MNAINTNNDISPSMGCLIEKSLAQVQKGI